MAQLRCESLFPSPITAEDVLSFANRMQGWGTKFASVEELAAHLRSRNSRFAQLAGPAGEALVRYHNSYFAQIQPSAPRLRESAMQRSLINRGAMLDPARTATSQFRDLSRQNARRFRQEKGVTDFYRTDHVIDEIVSTVRLRAHRNTETAQITSGAILSADRLSGYGFDGGLNSKLGFNREFLKSGDDVFFFVSQAPARKISGDGGKEYGAFTQELDPEFARAHAWVSPFVMYPRDLAEFFAKAQPDRYHLEDLLPAIGGDKRPSRDYAASDTAKELLAQLHRYDMRFTDYEALVRDQLGRALFELKNVPSASSKYGGKSYEECVRLIRDATTPEHVFKQLMQVLVMDPLGLHMMELKVPVLVPESALR